MTTNQRIERGQSGRLSAMVARGGAWMVGARLARTLISIIGMVFLARLLTPVDFGVVAIATSLTVLVLVVLEGAIDVPILRYDALSEDHVRSLVWASLAGTMLLGIALWVAAPAIERAMNFPNLAAALRLTAPVLVLQVHVVAGGALLRRKHRFREAAMLSIVGVVAYIVPAVALAFAGYGIWSILAAQIFATLLNAVLLAITAPVGLGLPTRFTFDGVGVAGGYGALSRLLAWAWTSVSTYAVALVLGPAATGIFSRAYNINVQMKEPFTALDQALRQAFAELKGTERGLADHGVMGLRLITLLSGLTAAAVIILREIVVLALLGTQWLAAAPLLAILAASFPARIARLYFDSLSASAGSMGNLLFRQAFLLVVISAGLTIFTKYGLEFVAYIVSGSVYLSVLLPQSKFDTASFGKLSHLLRAMIPGMLLAGVIIGLDILAIRPLMGPDLLGRTLVQLGMLAIAAFSIALLPARWLPGSWARLRSNILQRLGLSILTR